MKFGAWSIDLGQEELKTFKHHLACPPKWAHELAFKQKASAVKSHGSIFCRPEIKGANWRKIQIRSSQSLKHPGEKTVFRPLLFGGYASIGDREKSGQFKNRRTMNAFLSLNLQRFIRHQPVRDVFKTSPVEALPVRLRQRSDDRSTYPNETSLDGKDNWIPNTPAWRQFGSDKNVMHLRRYIKNVRSRLEREFKRASLFATIDGGGHGFKVEREYYALRSVENAWEFCSEDAIGDVENIGNLIAHLYEKRSRDDYIVSTKKGIKWERNSPCYHVSLAKNVTLRIYAKTLSRIRFEIIQQDVNWTKTLAASNSHGKKIKKSVRRDVSKDERSLDDLMQVFAELRKSAAKRMNDVMKELEDMHGEHRLYRPVVDLLAEIGGAVPCDCTKEEAARLTRAMLHILCGQRGFRGSASRGEFAPILKALKQSNIIQWSARDHFYKLNADFTRAAEAFQKVTSHYYSVFGGASTYRRFFLSDGSEIRDRIRN